MEAVDQSQSKRDGDPPGPKPIVGSGVAHWNVRRLLCATVALGAGFAMRAWMLGQFFEPNGDAVIYGGIARNLLRHGVYGVVREDGLLHATLIRLPGYPFFLAACFAFVGLENYVAVAWVQIVLDLAACLLLADCARRLAPEDAKEAAWQGALWLSALCPFTAIYAASPLTEGPTVFLLALALWAASVFLELPGWGAALTFTAAVTGAALLRPDGALAAVALAPVLLVALKKSSRPHRWRMAAVCTLLALAPFAAWTWRNWQVFHVVQPLAPPSATDPGEPVTPGWNEWVRTWALDFDSTYSVYWHVPDAPLKLEDVPTRAFDSPAERADAAILVREYNANGYHMTPWLDAGFAGLARKRIADAPMRYYLWLPLGRVADMWLRPRVENMPIDLDWWVYENHPEETVISWTFIALNALYLALAIAGLALRPRLEFRMLTWAMLVYMLLRSAVLAVTVVSPEARYTIECFPMLFVLGGLAISWGWRRAHARFRNS
jgi:hypothetical protein